MHGSLLPKYRGAAPIQWAVIHGEKETGVTTMMTDVGLDTGDILLARSTPIGEDETAGELFERLAVLGAEVLSDTIAALENGTLTRTPQDSARATKCSMLKKEDGHVAFADGMQQAHDRVRGMNPLPGAYAPVSYTHLDVYKRQMQAAFATILSITCTVRIPQSCLQGTRQKARWAASCSMA